VLVVRSLQHALTLNLGFNPNNAVSVSFDLRLQGYDEAHSRRFIAELLRKASALPGLTSVGIINNLPLRVAEHNGAIFRADRPRPPRSEFRASTIYNISPGYLETAGTRLLLGRDVNDHDREGTPPVAIVNEALVHLLFGNENPLGKHIRLGDQGLEIIGVVETGKYEYLGEDPHPAVFLPIAQAGPGAKLTTLVARTPLPAPQATDLLRKAVLDIDPELSLFNMGSLKDQLALPLFPARAAAIVLGVFGVVAMVLAATGLLALIAYSVARRMREIGIRMALGARPAQVLLRAPAHCHALHCWHLDWNDCYARRRAAVIRYSLWRKPARSRRLRNGDSPHNRGGSARLLESGRAGDPRRPGEDASRTIATDFGEPLSRVATNSLDSPESGGDFGLRRSVRFVHSLRFGPSTPAIPRGFVPAIF
jgi:MacB-like periplasmic core domain